MPLIEARRADRRAVARVRASRSSDAGCDTVILGCTHYPLIRPVFERVFGREVTLVFSADETAREVAETLAAKGWRERGRDARARYRFLTTGDPAAFRELGERFLQLPLGRGHPGHGRRARTGGCVSRGDGRRADAAPPASSADPAFLDAAARDGALVAGHDPRPLHRERDRERAPLAPPQRPRLGDRRVLAASRLDRRAHRARGGARQPGRPHGRDPAPDRPLDPRRDRLPGTRRAHRPPRLRRAPGRRRHALRGDLRRLRRARAARSTRFGLSKALVGSVAAVSVGVVGGESLLDLDYSEDSTAEVDLNVVMTGEGQYVEVQATAERVPFDRERLDQLLDLAAAGIERARRPAAGRDRRRLAD